MHQLDYQHPEQRPPKSRQGLFALRCGIVAVVTGLIIVGMMMIPVRHGPGDIWFPEPWEIWLAVGTPALNIVAAICAIANGIAVAFNRALPIDARRRGGWAILLGFAGPLLWLSVLGLDLMGSR